MDRTSLQSPEVGITPGLLNGAEVYDDRPVSRGREYDSEYVKLSMKGGHSSKLFKRLFSVSFVMSHCSLIIYFFVPLTPLFVLVTVLFSY